MKFLKGGRLKVGQALFANVVASFFAIGILIMLGKILVFDIMGKEYSRLTVIGFIGAVYLSFITFQPANTLFGVRKMILDGTVDVPLPASRDIRVRNPWSMTIPASFLVSFLITCISAVIIYHSDRIPSPAATSLMALLYVFPHYLLAQRFVEQDAASFTFSEPAPAASSRMRHFWIAYFLPNFTFQMIFNIPLAFRGFFPGDLLLSSRVFDTARVVPIAILGVDLTMTFILICNFTFLAVSMCAASDMHRGTLPGNEKYGQGPMHGFACFLVMLTTGLLAGGAYVFTVHATGHDQVSFLSALLVKVVCVFLAVYSGARFAMEWTAEKASTGIAVSA